MKRWVPDQPELIDRDHDLPPRWDGVPVAWGPWQPALPVLVCPPRPDDGCPQCGQPWQPRQSARGVVGQAVRLVVFRCPTCSLDTVVDLDRGEVWLLDLSDYSDAGSVAS